MDIARCQFFMLYSITSVGQIMFVPRPLCLALSWRLAETTGAHNVEASRTEKVLTVGNSFILLFKLSYGHRLEHDICREYLFNDGRHPLLGPEAVTFRTSWDPAEHRKLLGPGIDPA